jgi:hypothetical protein
LLDFVIGIPRLLKPDFRGQDDPGDLVEGVFLGQSGDKSIQALAGDWVAAKRQPNVLFVFQHNPWTW